MKKILLFFMMVLCAGSVLAIGSTGTITGRMTLSNGYIYTVPSSVTISASSSAAGLTVADNAIVTIYIPKGVTLTVNGSGRYAGIYIPSSSTLIITGEGTLNAKAGNNTTGASGGSGSAGSVWDGSRWSSGNTGHASAGNGGTGGAGGNGGGAAIGGNGGAGGAAKAGPTGLKDIECRLDNSYIRSGYSSYTGNDGGSGTTMGKLYVMGAVKVTATTGSQQTGSPSRGSDGSMGYYKWTHRYYAGGGGGGGFGGHGRIAPYGIGGGGYGGGSGASGASGGFEWSKNGSNWWNETGSYGGNGAGYSSTRTIGSYNSKSGYSNGYWIGGASAYGGYAGSNGGNGTVYRIIATDSNPTVSGAAATSSMTSYPLQVQATLSFNANKGTGAAANRTVYYGVKMADVAVPTRSDASGHYEFLGYYTAATGGTQVFKADGTPVSVSTIAANTTLYAHWKGTKFTFMNGTDEVKTTTFVTIPGQLDNTYTANPGTRPNPYFCGYYTASGIQVFDHNLRFTASGVAFSDTETLYAQFISTQHTVVWDYSYRYDAAVYHNLDVHNRYGRLVFKNAAGSVIKTVYLTANEVSNKDASTIKGDIATHTTSQMVVDLIVGTATDITDADSAKIYFTQVQLESMRGYQFDVWTTDGSAGAKAEHWYTNTNPTAHKTIFSYRGDISENMFWLSWNVTLTNLAMYPDKVYAKPMILKDGSYVEIDEMKGVWGEECFETGHVGTTGNGSSVTYSGEIPVLKNQFGGTEASSYKVGLTGFYLAGGNYFMDPTPGTIPSDLVSKDSIRFNGTGNDPGAKINYTVNDYDIPVVLLLPANPTAGVTDAHINHLKQILYVDQARAGKVSLSNFVAQREHFNFMGWYDAEMTAETGQNKVWGANEDYYFYTHTQPYGGTRTLIALWARDSKPEASIAMEQDDENQQYTYTVTATDEVAVKSVKYLIAEDGAEVTSATQGWSGPLALTDGKYSFSIPFVNEYFGKHVYVLVENEGNNTIVRDAEYIHSYLYLTANPDPDTATPNGTYSKSDQPMKDEEGNLVLDENQNPVYEDIFTPDGTYTYHDYYSTYYHSSEAYKLYDVVAYMVKSVNESASMLNLVQIKPNAHGEYILPKDEPVILKGTTPTFTLERILSDAENDGENILEGVDEETDQDSRYTYYVLSYAQNGLGFYQNLPERKLVAHKAFFTMPSAAAAPRAFNFNFYGPDTDNPIMTDIENVEEPEANEVVNGPVYDIYGHVVAPSLDQAGHLANGLYIVGGKKVVINK